MRKIQISPSILNADQSNIASEIERIATSADFLHLDIMDGIFVPNSTYDFKTAKGIISSSPLRVDAHLMVSDPDLQAPLYAAAGCMSVTFHYEASRDHLSIIKSIKKEGARCAIALKPSTPFRAIENLISELDMLLIMTVEPGFGGQRFMVDMMPKLREAKNFLTSHSLNEIWLQVDGGISTETIEVASQNGADTFVAGSAVYQADSPAQMVDKLRTLAQGSR
jgi:ribulose-phosphate 3-epimerase